MKEYSPFQPGVPVSPGMFVGREDQIREIDRYLKQTVAGRAQSVFLVGERGLGKTSLSSFILKYAEQEYSLLGVHTFMAGVSSLDQLVKVVFEGLLNRSESETWSKRVRKFFGKDVEEVGLFGINLKFRPSTENLEALVREFPEALRSFMNEIKKDRSGLLIILDDINGAVDSGEFANWFKSMIDRVSVSFERFPVFFLINGLPGKRDQLFGQQPSLMRIFQIMEIERLKNEEIRQFYDAAFTDAGKQVEPLGMKAMVDICSGLPIVMQEVGDAVFWVDKDNVISAEDAVNGVVEASDRIGKKYLDPTFYNVVRSDRYRSIISKVGKYLEWEFTTKELREHLTADESKVFGNFLRKLKELGIVAQPPELPRGSYRFTNRLYFIYLMLKG